MHVLTVLGARPQFIKAAVVSRAFQHHRPDVTETIVHTGQHYDANMSDVFFDDLAIPRPAHNLGIGGGSHGQNTGRMLERLEALILQNRPDWMLVFGDTDSTLAGALVAAKAHISLIHVEAGLRSIRLDQACFAVHFRSSRRRAFARISSFRITAVMATLEGFPASFRF